MPNPVGSPYTVIYAFGDSLSDAGDAYLITSSGYASDLGFSAEPVSPPYYQASYSGLTADEFSNGPVWVQDLAARLGLPTPAPASVGATYNELTAAVGQTAATTIVTLAGGGPGLAGGGNPYVTLVSGASGGTDFAVGGSVTGPSPENGGATGNNGATQNSNAAVPLTDLSAQITNFENEVPTPSATALYTIWSGSNDLLNLLEDANFAGLSPTTVSADISQSVTNEIDAVNSLIANNTQHGNATTNLLVLNVPDLGIVPAITQGHPSEVSTATTLSAQYNSLLDADLAALNTGGAHIYIEHVDTLIDSAVQSPATYGLTNTTTPVYTGSFTSQSVPPVSTDPATQNQYLFFDKQHPTETGHQFVAANALTALGLTCFAEDTRIATPGGERDVQTIGVGETVRLARGGEAQVIWAGHRHVDARRHPDPRSVWPVRIRAGAFGPGLPCADLLLSPNHSLFVEGVLIPVGRLIDEDAIVQISVDRITYWHLELATHDVLLAEGLPCESFLDTGQRMEFAGGAVTQLHPAFGVREWEAQACARLVVAGPELERARARLIGGVARAA